MQAAVGIAGQVNHHGHGLVGRGHPRGSPDVFVHADRLHATDPSGNLDECLGVRLDRAPTGVPRDAEMAGDRGHGGVVVPQRIDRPRHRPRRELRPWRREGVVLGPRRSRTSRLPAPPDPLEPPHPHRAGEAGRVVQHLDTATVTDRHHTAVRAPGQRLVGLHIEHQHAIVAGGHLEDMEAVNTEDLISPRTPGGAGRTRRVQHRQGLSFSSLVAADREGPDAFYPADTPQTAKPSSTLIWEGPVKDAKTEVGCCPLVRTRPNINWSRHRHGHGLPRDSPCNSRLWTAGPWQ